MSRRKQAKPRSVKGKRFLREGTTHMANEISCVKLAGIAKVTDLMFLRSDIMFIEFKYALFHIEK